MLSIATNSFKLIHIFRRSKRFNIEQLLTKRKKPNADSNETSKEMVNKIPAKPITGNKRKKYKIALLAIYHSIILAWS